MKRNKPVKLGALLKEYFNDIEKGDNILAARVLRTWDEVMEENITRATMSKYFKNGILYCTISSSILRSMLVARVYSVKEKINNSLGSDVVKKIVFR
ncbi:MAG: DUF721 domain-containing protein [Bacteroidales bacterium]|nr:DUF721 domain-containing protein [Bacteroidales bacterium]MBR4805967.1 DUF721 domain-containing protein [Bacteroidales bacterium]MBR4980312.1 DUF721 domain-containing protein [Bacteroidales bacterium]MBR5907452.1 DUF721 domain-containing protein [Bacteroidales bacterium]